MSFTGIAFTETWANDINEQFLHIPGYSRHLQFRPSKPGGGVGLFVKDHLSVSVRTDLNLFNTDISELTFVDIAITPYEKVTVGVVYRPPGENLTAFNDHYCQLLAKISFKSNCYIAGDFTSNINLLNCETHSETDNFLNNMFSHF